MRDTNIYSERLNGIEKDTEQGDLSTQADPAQFDPYTIRSLSSKELFGQPEEEELVDMQYSIPA